MSRIDRLTPEQEALLPQVRDEWLAVGLSTAPADRASAEAGVRMAYTAAGLMPPELVIWADSPLAGAMAAAMMAGTQVRAQISDQIWDQVGAQVRDQIWTQVGAQVRAQVSDQIWDQVRAQVQTQVWTQVGAQVRAQVGAQVLAQVWDQVGAQVWDQVWAQVWDQVGAQVWDQVWDQVRDQVLAQVWDQVRAQVGAQINCTVYGQHDAGWLGCYDMFGRIGVDCHRLDGLQLVARSAGWWWPFDHAVILTDRPCAIHRDAQGRLHCANGPALAYRDGFAIWAWHGVRVPPRVIEAPETITAQAVWAEQNAEIRRIMIERIGYERLIPDSGATVIHRDDWGALWRCEVPMPGAEQLWVVEVLNSTPEPDGSFKRYFLRVHPQIRPLLGAGTGGRPRYGPPQKATALNAVASTFGLTGAKYAAMVAQS